MDPPYPNNAAARLDNLRTAFDALVALQPRDIREGVRRTLGLGGFVDHILYVTAMRRPANFVSFIAFQLRLGGIEIPLLQLTEEELAAGSSAEALNEFVTMRGLFAVFLRVRNGGDESADEDFNFLHQRPPGAAGDNAEGYVALSLNGAYDRSLLGTGIGDNPGSDQDRYPFWRIIHLLRLAIPHQELAQTLRNLAPPGTEGEGNEVPTGFCLFASAFLHAAEAVESGFYEYIRDEAPAAFLYTLMQIFTGAVLHARILEHEVEAHASVRTRVLGLVRPPNAFNGFRDADDFRDVIRQFSSARPLTEANRLASWIWNTGVFNQWLQRQSPQLRLEIGEAAMHQLDRDLEDMTEIRRGEVVWAEDSTYVDAEMLFAQRDYDNQPSTFDGQTITGFQPSGTVGTGNEPVDDGEDMGECLVCAYPLGRGPRREAWMRLGCCGQVIGQECAIGWITARGTCPLCNRTRGLDWPEEIFSSGPPRTPSDPGSPSAGGRPGPLPNRNQGGAPVAEREPAAGPASEDESLPDYESPEENGEWYETVFMPAAQFQHREKSKAGQRNEAWESLTFEKVDTSASVAGPSRAARQALRDWLLTVVRPLVRQAVIQGVAETNTWAAGPSLPLPVNWAAWLAPGPALPNAFQASLSSSPSPSPSSSPSPLPTRPQSLISV